ncbi:MAG: hypothetical protein ABW215_08730 [Kibdelosporangium sp.]
MTDVRTLNDAFAELERRADAAFAGTVPDLPLRRRSDRTPRSGFRLMAMAATVTAVAGLAVGAVLLAPDGSSGIQTGAPPPTIGSAATPAAKALTEPSTPEELAARFRAVLGDTATFVVTYGGPGSVEITLPPGPGGGKPSTPSSAPKSRGAAINGTLTAGGVTGGFDLFIAAQRGGSASCRDSDECNVSTLPDGSSLAIGRMSLEGPSGGTTYSADLVSPDGIQISMHVSDQRSPKGASERIAQNPPLTTDQLTEIMKSDRW